MVKRSTRFYLALILGLALVAMAACSGGQTAPPPATSAAKPAAPATAAPAPAAPAPAATAPAPAAPAAATQAPAAAPASAGLKGGVTPEQKAAALKEGEVTYYTAATTLTANRMKAAAEKDLGIKVNVVRLSTSLIYNRVLKEYEDNVNAADVMESSVIDQYVDLKSKNMLLQFTPSAINLYRGPDYYDADHYWHASRLGMGAMNYNSKLLTGAMIPKTWKELMDPKYKDKIVQGHIKASGTSAILDFYLVKLYGWEFFAAMQKNNIMTQQSCDQTNLIAQGERLIGLCDNQITSGAVLSGLPLATVFPEDGVFVQVGPAAILAKAPHPNAGRLFLDWLTGPAGQQVHIDGGTLSPIVTPDIKYPANLPDVTKLKLLIPDPKEVGAWMKGATDKFTELFGG